MSQHINIIPPFSTLVWSSMKQANNTKINFVAIHQEIIYYVFVFMIYINKKTHVRKPLETENKHSHCSI